MYTLLKTTNKLSGKTSYYADGHNRQGFKRTSKANYEWLELLYKRWDCLHSRSDSKYTRQYKTIS